LDGKKREQPPTPKLLNGEQFAPIIAMRLGPPPPGYANWTLRLLASWVVELEIVDSPKHGSWLNIAENELSAMTRHINNKQRGVDWQMKISDARRKLKSVYPKIKF
jgi:hypothetical protein